MGSLESGRGEGGGGWGRGVIWINISFDGLPEQLQSGRGGGGGGGEGGRVGSDERANSFQGLLGQLKEISLLVLSGESLGSAVGFCLFVGVTFCVLLSWDSSDDSSFLFMTWKLWMFLSGLQPGGRLRIIKLWNQHYEKQNMRLSSRDNLTLMLIKYWSCVVMFLFFVNFTEIN